MPGLDDYAVAAKMRSTPGFDKTGVIAPTAWSDASARVKAAGFDSHLVKPASFATILGALDVAK